MFSIKTLEEIVNIFETKYNVKLTGYGIGKLSEFCLMYCPNMVYEAVEICCDKYEEPEFSFSKIGGVLYNKYKDIKKCFE